MILPGSATSVRRAASSTFLARLRRRGYATASTHSGPSFFGPLTAVLTREARSSSEGWGRSSSTTSRAAFSPRLRPAGGGWVITACCKCELEQL